MGCSTLNDNMKHKRRYDDFNSDVESEVDTIDT